MKLHKKFILITVICGILFALSLSVLFNSVTTEIDERYKQHLNTQYVIGADTLTIVDFSIIHDAFYLSNGMRISAQIIEQDGTLNINQTKEIWERED